MFRKVFEFGERFFIEFIEEWSQFFESCNWYTFRPVMVEIEDDRALGAFEMTIILLGVGVRFRYNHTMTETKREIIEAVEYIKSEGVEKLLKTGYLKEFKRHGEED